MTAEIVNLTARRVRKSMFPMQYALQQVAALPTLDYEELYFALRSTAQEVRHLQIRAESGMPVSHDALHNLTSALDDILEVHP